MPDLGLPRALTRGELCMICGTAKRASFRDALCWFGGGGSAPHRRRASRACKRGLPRAFCARHAFDMPRTFRFGIGLRDAIQGYSSSLMTRSMSSWRECTSSFA